MSNQVMVAPQLASAKVAPDFARYELRRIGILPHKGKRLEPLEEASFSEALFGEFSRQTPYEFVPLSLADQEGVIDSRPYELGRYQPQTIIEITERFELDALLFPTIVNRKWYPPQEISVSVDLVSADTGMVIWTSVVHLDGDDVDTVNALREFYNYRPKVLDQWGDDSWDAALISPSKFTRFALHELATLL